MRPATSTLATPEAPDGPSRRRLRPRTRPPRAAPVRVDGVRHPVRAHGRRLRRPPGHRVDVLAPQGGVEPLRRPARRARLDRLRDRRRSAPSRCRCSRTAGAASRASSSWRSSGASRRSPARSREATRSSSPRAGVVGLGEAAYGTVGAALIATLFPVRMRSSVLGAFFLAGILGSVLGVVLGGVIAAALGLAGGLRRGRRARASCSPFVFLFIVRDYKTVALPEGERKRQPRRARRARHRRRAAAAAHRARRVARRRLPAPHAVDDVRVAADLLQPLLRPRAGRGGAQGGTRRARRRRRRLRVGRRGGPAHAAHRVRAPVRARGGRRADGGPDGQRVRRCFRPATRSSR